MNLHAKLQNEEDEFFQELEKMKTNVISDTQKVKSVLDKALMDVQKKIHEIVSLAPTPNNTRKVPPEILWSECESVLKKVPEEISYFCDTNPFM